MRDEIAALNSGKSSPALEKLRSEKAAIEEQLGIARDERAKAQRDLNAMQQQAESSWATERMENALLRERINDIAAEVAKLAMQLEGPNSAIDAILAAEPVAPPIALKPANDMPANGAVPTMSSCPWAARWPTASARCSRMPRGRGSRAEYREAGRYARITKLPKALGENRAPVEALTSHDADNPRKNLNGAREIPRQLRHLCPVTARRCKICGMSQKSRAGNHVAMEALMVHGHATAARRADLVRRDQDSRPAIYALQTDLAERSST